MGMKDQFLLRSEMIMSAVIQREQEYNRITVAPLAGALGAEIFGVDITDVDQETYVEIHQAFLNHSVIFFRDQDLTPETQMAFGRLFGPLNRHSYVKGMNDYPDVFRIVKEPTDVHHFGNAWHSDLAYEEKPALATILYGIDVPEVGGDTMFTSLYAAYDALSDGMKRMLADLRIVFTNANTYGKDATRFKAGVARDMTVAQAPEEKEVQHPIVRTHPETGRKALYLSTTHFSRIEGMSKAESQPLLDQLAKHAVRPDFTCRFKWRPGSIAMWDNRCTMHYAVNDFPEARRIMQRVTLQGDRPY
jgi:taurine dioxygenase